MPATTVPQPAAQDAFVEHYYTDCCEHLDGNADKSRHIAEKHLLAVLEHFIRPLFSQHKHPAFDKGPRTRYGGDPRADSDFLDNQLWKQTDNRFSAADVLEWTLSTCSKNELDAIVLQVIPPTLLVLDDFDIVFKTRGVTLVHHLVRKLDGVALSRHGLEDVFVDALFKCLTYVSEDRDIPLLETAYPCLVDLVDKTKIAGSKERIVLFERILIDGVILGLKYSGHKIKFLKVLLQPVKRIYEELGALGVRHLEVVIPSLCSAFKLASSESMNMDLCICAIQGLDTVIAQCWPRIPRYRGIILAGLAATWMHTYTIESVEICEPGTPKKGTRDTYLELIRQTFQHLRAACEDDIELDINYLLAWNKDVFSPLFS